MALLKYRLSKYFLIDFYVGINMMTLGVEMRQGFKNTAKKPKTEKVDEYVWGIIK